MARKIGQVRFYNDGSSKNYPNDITKTKLITGVPFDDLKIVQLGIQAQPGTQFYLNHHPVPLVVGFTGIYELDLSDLTYIRGLCFNANSLNTIDSSDIEWLLIDYIYEDEEEN